MKPVKGTPYFIPDCDEHLLSKHERTGVRFFDNYQHDRIEKAFGFVTDWSIAVDGGANVGLLTHKIAERFDKVYSFEPAPDCFDCLLKNTEHLKNVVCTNVALGEKQKVVGIDGDMPNTGARQVDPDGDGIPMITIDSLQLPSLGLFKLDVQGYEYLALRGATETLKRCKPVCIVEVEDPKKIPRKFRGTESPKTAVNYLAKLGARFRVAVGVDWIMSWD